MSRILPHTGNIGRLRGRVVTFCPVGDVNAGARSRSLPSEWGP